MEAPGSYREHASLQQAAASAPIAQGVGRLLSPGTEGLLWETLHAAAGVLVATGVRPVAAPAEGSAALADSEA